MSASTDDGVAAPVDDRTWQQSMGSRWRSVGAMATTSLWADRRRTILSIGLDIAEGLAGPFLAIGSGLLVDALLDDTGIAAAVAVLAVAVGVLLSFSIAGNRVRIRLEENVAHQVEIDVLHMVTGLPGIAHHENPAHIHRVDRLLEESWLIGMAVPALISGVEIITRFLLTVGVLASIDGRLAFLPLACVPTVWAGAVAERIRLRAMEARAEAGRRGDDLFRLVGKTESAGELRSSGVGDHLLATHEIALDIIATDERDHRLAGGWRLAIGRLLFTAGFGAGLLLVIGRAAAGDLSAGEVVMVIGLAAQVVGQAASLTGRLNWINWALTGVRHYVWLLDYDAEHRRSAGPVPAPDVLRDGIRFEGVSFTYPGTERAVLDDLDLTLPAGSITAIVGDNGTGKTTLIKLLLRLYEPTNGTITVDGTPLPEIDVDDWRSRTAAALQEHTRPELLLGEAIAIGNVDAVPDDVAAPDIDDDDPLARTIEGAARRSGADSVIAVVPEGIRAQLGLEWPKGTDLSGGQWQRLAVARSAMRDRALLLILDEPTAALDPTAEQALFEQYVGADRRSDAVTVVISHRLSTVRNADNIVVLAGGRITETGTHDALLEAGGDYAALFDMQAANYR